MEAQPQDVRQALDDIEQTAQKAQRRESYKGADIIFMVWGVTWIIGFLIQHFFRDASVQLGDCKAYVGGWAWNILVPIAIVVTLLVSRRRIPTQSVLDKRMGALWGLLFAYFFMVLFVLQPVIDLDRLYSESGQRSFLAAIVLVPMLAWVLMGLFSNNSRYIMWMGLAITAANLFGFFALGAWYYLWMAVTGGGTMIAAGIITRRAWRRA